MQTTMALAASLAPLVVQRIASAPRGLACTRSLRQAGPVQQQQQRRASRHECRAASEAAVGSSTGEQLAEGGDVPTPVVKIDNQSDPFATIVTIEYGDRLGELLDTMRSLKSLGLNIRRAKITPGASNNRFYITDAKTSEKVVKSAVIEEIRLTILNCLLEYHPESGETLAWGPRAMAAAGAFDATHPLGLESRKVINTFIDIHENEAGTFSVISLRTLDRPGLLVDIVRVLKDISVNVVSAEVDTEGREAVDTFFVTYHGEPLSPSMVQLVANCLQYYLSMASVEREESY